jgi:MurNAc alpha-1-phosphate uridylyltransferase
VAGVPLVDHALGRLREVTSDLAVNVHDSHPALLAHLDGVATISVESGPRLGTAGGVANLRDWIGGRPAVVVNGDTWCPGGLGTLVEGWDGERIRILVAGPDALGPRSRIAGALMPWRDVSLLRPEPSGLWEVMWRAALERGRIETVHHHGPFVDCAGPGEYLEANLLAAGGSVIGAGAVVAGTVEDSVLWPGAVVRPGEHLRRAIRTDTGRTVLVRS